MTSHTTVAVLAATLPGDKRVPLLPAAAQQLQGLGFELFVEKGAGVQSGFSDADYSDAGATIAPRKDALAKAGLVLSLTGPDADDLKSVKSGAYWLGVLDPYRSRESIEALASAGVEAMSLDMVPRITRAQSMDVLSSQANLAGYAAVLQGFVRVGRIAPMMMTAAGTLQPTRVLVIGVGVAGLQAIATAKRLGARVFAFDTRPVVKEQVKSLGARFVEIDIGELGETEGGYARELTPEQLEKQQKGLADFIAKSDLVVTTAQVFGRPAPQIVKKDMVDAMQAGSVIVDMATATGGNVAGSKVGTDVELKNGVTILDGSNLVSMVARDASTVFSNNLLALLNICLAGEGEEQTFAPDKSDEIIAACHIVSSGAVVHQPLLDAWG